MSTRIDNMYTLGGFIENAKRIAEERYKLGRWPREKADAFIADAPARWKELGNETAWERRFGCNTCQDQGSVFVEGQGAMPCPDNCAKAQADAQRRYQTWKSKVEHMGRLKYTEDLTFDSWLKMHAWKREDKSIPFMAAKLYAESPNQYISLLDAFKRTRIKPPPEVTDEKRNSIIFYGAFGVGKTGLAASIMWELEARKIPCLMVRTYSMLEQIKSLHNRSIAEEWEMTPHMLLKNIQTIPVLLMDEWGADRDASEWDQEQMQEIVRYRCAQRLPMIITTNKYPRHDDLRYDEFYQYWGGRTADVLRESAWYIEVGGARIRGDAPMISEVRE